MLEEMRKRAREKRAGVYGDPASTELDRRKADMVVEFLSKEEGFNQVPRSTVIQTFIYLGYDVSIDQYDELYDQVMREVNGTYVFVDPEQMGKD